MLINVIHDLVACACNWVCGRIYLGANVLEELLYHVDHFEIVPGLRLTQSAGFLVAESKRYRVMNKLEVTIYLRLASCKLNTVYHDREFRVDVGK